MARARRLASWALLVRGQPHCASQAGFGKRVAQVELALPGEMEGICQLGVVALLMAYKGCDPLGPELAD